MQAISHSPLTTIAHFALVPIFLGCLGAANASESVLCHATYGGETRTLKATPVSSSYAVEPMSLGSYFQLRVVFQKHPAELAGIKIYTYADREPSPVIIHQASYPYPVKSVAPAGDFMQGTNSGFTGLNWVYETVRDSELQYWCELKSGTTK